MGPQHGAEGTRFSDSAQAKGDGGLSLCSFSLVTIAAASTFPTELPDGGMFPLAFPFPRCLLLRISFGAQNADSGTIVAALLSCLFVRFFLMLSCITIIKTIGLKDLF